MENLLATPVRPFEVMVGKILPYVVMGYVQLGVILGAAWLLFQVPMLGSFSVADADDRCVHRRQSGGGIHLLHHRAQPAAGDADDLLFFLPSMLLSGFMFPSGHAEWVQALGEVLPLTHFLRIVRGIMLKGAQAPQLWGELWPMLLFMAVAGVIALKRYRQTLD
ncbi:MAG: ABC transporter permease [Burkholderiaceae bacterium]